MKQSKFLQTGYITIMLASVFASKPAFTQTCFPPPSHLVSWWSAESNALDSAEGNNGTLGTGTSFATGEVGQAFSFDGTDDYVRVPDAANLRITNAITIE